MTIKKPKLSKAQKRVLVARDVMNLLAAGKIKAVTGDYFEASAEIIIGKDDKLQPVLRKLETCNACAIGACFLAHVLRFDGMVGSDIKYPYPTKYRSLSPQDMKTKLKELFSAEQLTSIEDAFERSGINDKIRHFGNQYLNDADRLRAICQNIVDNEGTFKP